MSEHYDTVFKDSGKPKACQKCAQKLNAGDKIHVWIKLGTNNAKRYFMYHSDCWQKELDEAIGKSK
ncbi:MAG: hypothetical protein WC554_17305 [Clostridia bacterium]|jgi:hypothetical protein